MNHGGRHNGCGDVELLLGLHNSDVDIAVDVIFDWERGYECQIINVVVNLLRRLTCTNSSEMLPKRLNT